MKNRNLIEKTILGISFIAIVFALMACQINPPKPEPSPVPPRSNPLQMKVWETTKTPVTADNLCKKDFYWNVHDYDGDVFAYEYTCDGQYHYEKKFKWPDELKASVGRKTPAMIKAWKLFPKKKGI